MLISAPVIDYLEHDLPPAFTYALCFLFAFSLVIFSIPSVILVATKKRLMDKPNHRKHHKKITSNFGGLPIYCATIFVVSMLGISNFLPAWNYIMAASFMLFITGLKDDVLAITFKQKFIVQFFASFIVVFFADIRLHNLYGLFGINELPPVLSIVISTIGITFVTNAYNLIDGIDGLCGTLSFLESFLFGLFFSKTGDWGYAILAFTFSGGILGFLYYNVSPARIFMGDTGSLITGFFLSVFGLAMINEKIPSDLLNAIPNYKAASIGISFAICIIPIFDTIRVFAARIIHKQPPFKPDRRHIHHLLIDAGCTHSRAVAYLVSTNIAIIALTILFFKFKIPLAIVVLLQLFVCLSLIIWTLRARNNAMSKNGNDNNLDSKGKVSTLSRI